MLILQILVYFLKILAFSIFSRELPTRTCHEHA